MDRACELAVGTGALAPNSSSAEVWGNKQSVGQTLTNSKFVNIYLAAVLGFDTTISIPANNCYRERVRLPEAQKTATRLLTATLRVTVSHVYYANNHEFA